MKQYQVSKKQYSFIIAISLFIHLCMICMLLQQPITSNKLFKEVNVSIEQDEYLVRQILSAGSQQPTTYFQDDAQPEETSTDEPDIESAPEPTGNIQKPLQETITQAQTTTMREHNQLQVHSNTEPVVHKKNLPLYKKQSKREVTLADISRGFMQNMQQHAGHNNPAHDAKELALQMYASKVWNAIKSSFLCGESRIHLPQAIQARTHLQLTINRAGKLVEVKLVYPKHIRELQTIEELIITRAKQAGLFPPFPSHMSGETQRFSFPLFIQGEQGFHSYSLGYQ